MMRRWFLLLSGVMQLSLVLGMESARDSSKIELDSTESDSIRFELEQSGFIRNLDSLLTLWYVVHQEEYNPLDEIEASADTVFPVFSDSVYIERLDKIPSLIELSYNKRVRNYIELYTNKRRKQVRVLLGLSEYYFPIFEEVFAYYDLPLELKYCSIIESALNPRAVSRVGATGIWQFMYGTGRKYGLTINSFVDERRDPLKSTDAAARFMQDLYAIYHDWILVIAAYNCGPGNVNKAIRRSGGKTNYWDIYYYLPRETRGHVPAFIAATYFMNYYKEHNLNPVYVNLPIPVDTIMIDDELHLEQVSHVVGVPVEMLRDLNPQYKWDIIPGKEKPYALRIPLTYSTQFIALQDSVFTYNDSVYFNHDKVRGPADYSSSRYLPEPPSKDMSKVYYTIKSGDNLGYIASWYHVRVSDLKYWNNIYGSMIRSGQKLVVYVPNSKLEKYKMINTMTFEEKQRSVGKEVAFAKPAEDTEQFNYQGDFIYYTVRSGDTLWDIAKQYDGITDTDIMRVNNISDAGKIKPGQVLKIPVKG